MASINTKTISEFKTKLSGGGARPNLFEVVIPSFPSGVNDAWDQEEQRDFKFLCKAAQLPGSTVPAISAFIPSFAKFFLLFGAKTEIPPIWIPIDKKLLSELTVVLMYSSYTQQY